MAAKHRKRRDEQPCLDSVPPGYRVRPHHLTHYSWKAGWDCCAFGFGNLRQDAGLDAG